MGVVYIIASLWKHPRLVSYQRVEGFKDAKKPFACISYINFLHVIWLCPGFNAFLSLTANTNT
jgi:hypothetical protein